MYTLKFDQSLITAKEATLITSTQDGLAIFNASALEVRKSIKVATHDGMFHADELLAITLLKEALGGVEVEILRTRNPQLLVEADLRVDVGEGLLDHHGKQAEDGVAACTKVFSLLVQTELAKGHRAQVGAAALQYLEDIVARVAAWDCGDNSKDHPFPWVHTFAECARMLESEGDYINKCINMMYDIMDAETSIIQKKSRALRLAESQLAEQATEKVVVFNESARWADVKQMMYDKKADCVFYVSPESEDDWRVLCAANPDEEFSPFSSRQLLPEQYRGLRGEALSEKAGIEGGIFCHAAGFIAGFKTQKAAVEFAKKCLGA